MDLVQLSKAAKAAKKRAASISSRHSGNFRGKAVAAALADPEEGSSEEEFEEGTEQQLWRLLPQLKDMPEHFLKMLPVSTMFQLNAAL